MCRCSTRTGAHVIADGGCTCPGDVAKGFGGGADFVMLGGMLAGHDEGNGKIVKINGEKYIEFYGSSSEVATKTLRWTFRLSK